MAKLKYIFTIIVALSLTVISALALYRYLTRKRYNPEKLLEEVKSYFMEVNYSYIIHEPFVHPQLNNNRLVYQGGISIIKNGSTIDYDFYADAYTGEVLDIIEQ